ncbi:hypothetical protein H5T57_02915 [Candidatus Bipolaricaulota bacterium]|nr:hypothetical protein [Candidatus Bipolaricaulota bacterium]
MKWLALGMIFLFLPAGAFELSGSFSTGLTLAPAPSAPWNTLNLQLSFGSWEIQSSSTWQSFTLNKQSFAVAGNLGNLGIEAGVVLLPVTAPRLGAWTTQEFRVSESFLALELSLGQIRLKLVLQVGLDKP